MSLKLVGPVLEGALVRLEPLEHRHAADLAVAPEDEHGRPDPPPTRGAFCLEAAVTSQRRSRHFSPSGGAPSGGV